MYRPSARADGPGRVHVVHPDFQNEKSRDGSTKHLVAAQSVTVGYVTAYISAVMHHFGPLAPRCGLQPLVVRGYHGKF